MFFSQLHCHTQWSALDGFGSPKRWVARLQELGMKSIAVTDHGNIDCVIKMSQACHEAGIKFVAGCELYICKDMTQHNSQADSRHICVWVKNATGWKNLLQMLSEANIRGYHYKPRIDGKCLLKHREGLIISTACVASFVQTSWGQKLFKDLVECKDTELFLEVMPHDLQEQRQFNKKILKYAKQYGLPVIATNDCHYPNRSDAELQEVCLAINSGSTWDDPKRFRFDGDTYFLASAREMLEMFEKNHPYMPRRDVKEYLANTQHIIDACQDFHLDKILPDLPLSPNVPIDELKESGLTEDDYFRSLIKQGFKQKREEFVCPAAKYKERIREELDLLIKKKFTRYFLIVIDILRFCKENGIAVGPGRGSVGGCLIAWLTGITKVDPLKYDLLFARFQDPAREDLPDIDLDFEQDRREEVVSYIRSVYGEENVAQITTFLTMKGKMALQDVGRVFKVPRSEITEVTKYLDDNEDFEEQSFKESPVPEIREFYKNHRKVVRLACEIKDTIRGYGKHAAGVCISNHNLTQGINGNLAKRQGILVSNWDKDEGEYMGLMKLDVLGLTALSRIRVCCEMIKQNRGIDIDLEKIDPEDKKSLKTINRGDCVGIFQLGTSGLSRYCKDLGISSFKDVYNATALFRPGTLGSGMAMEFVERKNGKPYKPIHPKAVPFTEDTEGIILYQEQCMFLFKELAGFDWGKCNKVRKVVAKSKGEEALNVFKADFVAGCQKVSGITEDGAVKIWESIVDFSKYAFNRSHSVEYSIISMWDAYLKTYYAGEFYASCLSYLNEDKRIEIIEEASDRGIKVVLPKYGLSDSVRWRYNPDMSVLVMPFNEINGIGDKAAEQIEKCSKAKRKTFFGSKANLSSLPSSVRAALSAIHFEDLKWSPTAKECKKIQELFKYDLNRILTFDI